MQKYSTKYLQTKPRTHQRYSSPSSWLHPRIIGIVQHTEIHQCSPPYKQMEEKRAFLRCENSIWIALHRGIMSLVLSAQTTNLIHISHDIVSLCTTCLFTVEDL